MITMNLQVLLEIKEVRNIPDGQKKKALGCV